MRIGEYEMESPLMNGGGVVKSVEDAQQMAATGIGAVLGGSFTLDERIGNSPNGETVYHHDPLTGTTYNALGMPNKGLRTLVASGALCQMVEVVHGAGKPFILNFAPVTDKPVTEIKAAGDLLEKSGVAVDGFELNASCPNVVSSGGGRHELLSYHPDMLGDVLDALNDIAANKVSLGTVIARISPFRDYHDMQGIIALDELVDTVAVFNTFPGGKPLAADGADILQVAGGTGGKSGPAMADEAERQQVRFIELQHAAGAFSEIIGSNGVMDGQSLLRRLELGASAVSATTMFYESSDWGRTVDRVLRQYAEIAA